MELEGEVPMIAKRNYEVTVLTLALLTLSLALPAWAGGFSDGVDDVLGPRYHAASRLHVVRRHSPGHGINPIARLHHWNAIAVDVSGLDHTPVAPGEQRTFGEQ